MKKFTSCFFLASVACTLAATPEKDFQDLSRNLRHEFVRGLVVLLRVPTNTSDVLAQSNRYAIARFGAQSTQQPRPTPEQDTPQQIISLREQILNTIIQPLLWHIRYNHVSILSNVLIFLALARIQSPPSSFNTQQPFWWPLIPSLPITPPQSADESILTMSQFVAELNESATARSSFDLSSDNSETIDPFAGMLLDEEDLLSNESSLTTLFNEQFLTAHDFNQESIVNWYNARMYEYTAVDYNQPLFTNPLQVNALLHRTLPSHLEIQCALGQQSNVLEQIDEITADATNTLTPALKTSLILSAIEIAIAQHNRPLLEALIHHIQPATLTLEKSCKPLFLRITWRMYYTFPALYKMFEALVSQQSAS